MERIRKIMKKTKKIGRMIKKELSSSTAAMITMMNMMEKTTMRKTTKMKTTMKKMRKIGEMMIKELKLRMKTMITTMLMTKMRKKKKTSMKGKIMMKMRKRRTKNELFSL